MDFGNAVPSLIEETKTIDGFVMGTYCDPFSEECLHVGSGYVLMPDGSRLDVVWEWYESYRAVYADGSGSEIALPPAEETDDGDDGDAWESQARREEIEAFDREAFDRDHPCLGRVRYEIPMPLKTPRDVRDMFRKMLPLYRNFYDLVLASEGEPICVGSVFKHFYGCTLTDALSVNLARRARVRQEEGGRSAIHK